MTDYLLNGRGNSSKNGKKPLPHGWVVVASKSYPDRVYYYNTITRCSTWENPCSDTTTAIYRLKTPERPNTQGNASTSNSQAGNSRRISSVSSRSLDDDNNSMLIDDEIEEYDEDHNDYFDNVPMNTFSLRRADLTSPPNSPDDLFPKPSRPTSKIIPSNEPKELWTRFLNCTTPKTNQPKKSLVLSLGSTTENLKGVEMRKPEEKRVVHPKVLSDLAESDRNVKSPPKKDALRFSKSQRKEPRFKKTAENIVFAKKIPKLSTVLGSQADEIKNSSPLCDIYKVNPTTPAQSRLTKIHQENLETVQKNSKASRVLNESSSAGSLLETRQRTLGTPQKNSKLSSNEQPGNGRRESSVVRQGNLKTAQKNLPAKVLSEQPSNSGSGILQGRFQRIREEFVKNSGKLVINPKHLLLNDGSGVAKKKKKIHFVGETRAEFHPGDPVTSTPFSEEPEEEMEWEPCDEEEMIEQINQIRKTLPVEQELSHILVSDQAMDNCENTESLSWIIVLDTNILLSSLNFIKDLRDTKINDVGFPVVYIPWRVLQELDHLKDSPQLKVAARRAISYINENFISSHPRFRGQSYQEFTAMSKSESELPDDDILQTCFQLQKEVRDKKLILLTNDKNLESKACVSKIESYSKERFLKEMGFSKDTTLNIVNNNNDGSNRLSSASAGSGTTIEESDSMLCQLKAILRKVLTYVVKTELKLAYGDDWQKMMKDRDWSLPDLIGCFLKYWRSVFHFVFPKETLERVESLKKAFQNGNLGQKDEVKSTVIISQELLVYIKRCKEIRPYMDLVDLSVKDLNLLLNPKVPVVENQDASRNQSDTSNVIQIKSEPVDYVDTRICDSQSHIEKIRNIFRDIWNFVRNFWDSLTNSLNESNPENDKASLVTIKTELSTVCRNLQDLILSLEKVTLLDLSDVCENNQVILNLTEILIKFGTSISSSFADIYLSDDMSYSVSVFCGNSSGRNLLETSLSDFKDFFSELVKSYEYIQQT